MISATQSTSMYCTAETWSFIKEAIMHRHHGTETRIHRHFSLARIQRFHPKSATVQLFVASSNTIFASQISQVSPNCIYPISFNLNIYLLNGYFKYLSIMALWLKDPPKSSPSSSNPRLESCRYYSLRLFLRPFSSLRRLPLCHMVNTSALWEYLVLFN